MRVDEGLRCHSVYGFNSIRTHGYLKTTLELLEPPQMLFLLISMLKRWFYGVATRPFI